MENFQPVNTPIFVPRCPECGCELEGVPFPLPKKGKGRCPMAGYYTFEVDVNETEQKKDKFGNIIKQARWIVSPDGEDQHD